MRRIHFIKKKVTSLNLHLKLVLLMGVALLSLFIGTFNYFTYEIKSQMNTALYDSFEASNDQLMSNLKLKLEHLISVTNIIYADYQIKALLTDSYNSVLEHMMFYEELEKSIKNIIASTPDILSVRIYTYNESILPDKKYIFKIEDLMRNGGLYQEVVAARGRSIFVTSEDIKGFAKQYIDTFTKGSILGFRLLNHTEEGGPYGVMCIEIDERAFSNFFPVEEGRESFIIDQEDKVLIASDKQYISTYLEYESEEGDSIKREGNRPIEKDRKIGIVRELNNQLGVVSRMDTRIWYENIDKDISKLNRVGIMIFVTSFGVVYLILTLFTRKIRYLNQVIRHANKGEFDIQIKDMGNDEVGQVIQSFKALLRRINYLMQEVYQKEIEKKSIEMELLHAQINPHFLYNTLACITALARPYKDQRLTDMIMALANMYRISLSRGQKNITISKEIELTRNYICIMEHRFKGMIDVKLQYEEAIGEVIIPKLFLQPFIENAINHGIKDDELLHINILGYKDDPSNIVFEIIDDGCGMAKETIREITEDKTGVRGYGICNVNNRIKIKYGQAYGVEIFSEIDQGTKVKIILPFE